MVNERLESECRPNFAILDMCHRPPTSPSNSTSISAYWRLDSTRRRYSRLVRAVKHRVNDADVAQFSWAFMNRLTCVR